MLLKNWIKALAIWSCVAVYFVAIDHYFAYKPASPSFSWENGQFYGK